MPSLEVLTDQNFFKFISTGNRVVVIGRESCEDCRGYAEIIAQIIMDSERKKSNIKFGYLDSEKDNNQTKITIKSQREYMKSVPHTVLYKKGQVVDRINDVVNNTLVRGHIKTYLGVDI